jgi:hypothetical protein
MIYLMVFNATFNNISVISWLSVLLVEDTGGPGENLLQVTDKLYYIMLYTSPWSRFELTTSVVIGTDCIGSCKSNYHTITAKMAPVMSWDTLKESLLFNAKWAIFQLYHDENKLQFDEIMMMMSALF